MLLFALASPGGEPAIASPYIPPAAPSLSACGARAARDRVDILPARTNVVGAERASRMRNDTTGVIDSRQARRRHNRGLSGAALRCRQPMEFDP